MKEHLDEQFLDNIFGAKSKVLRHEWEELVAKNEAWLFSSKKIREQTNKALKERK